MCYFKKKAEGQWLSEKCGELSCTSLLFKTLGLQDEEKRKMEEEANLSCSPYLGVWRGESGDMWKK